MQERLEEENVVDRRSSEQVHVHMLLDSSESSERIREDAPSLNSREMKGHDIPGNGVSEESEKSNGAIDLLMGRRPDEVPRPRRVFVNRSLWLDRIDWIGFDMDYTLLRYHAEPMEELCYRKSIEKLIEMGYSEEIASFEYHPQRAMRGLLIDKERGNLLQINRHRHVGAAYHGYKVLSKEERRQIYRLDPMKFSVVEGGHSSSEKTGYRKFRMLDSLFGVPEACLLCDLVHWFEEKNPDESIDYLKLYNDLRTSMDNAHADGLISQAILENMGRYIVLDPEIALVLERFRVSGKKLFLLTNSPWDYTDAVMTFLLDGQLKHRERWSDFFDLVIVSAQKPAFFKKNTPFEILDELGNSKGECVEIKDEKFLKGGHQKALNQYLGGVGERVLYVGDHIYGDILQTKKTSTWRTILIIEELERELILLQDVKEQWARWEALEDRRNQLNQEISEQAMILEGLKALEKPSDDSGGRVTLQEQAQATALRRVESNLTHTERELAEVVEKSTALLEQINSGFNPFWGMLFREGHQYSYLADQILSYACVYTSRVTNFLNYAPNHYFLPPMPLLPHDVPGE